MIRVRLAPSLAGPLFISGARVALANHLFARRNDGRLLLRLDDLEPARINPSLIEQTLQDLRWFGVEWDECWHQSQRLARYQDAIARLQQQGVLYPCFETEAELKAKQEFRRKRNRSTIYDRAMLLLTPQQRQAAEAGGKRPHWRLRLPNQTLEWRDMIAGNCRIALPTVSDPVLVRADGTPLPILASVVDDLDFGTTHVIRGEDSVGNTAIQLVLLQALTGAPVAIRFAHLPALVEQPMPPPAGSHQRLQAAGEPEASNTAGRPKPSGASRRVGSLSLRGLRNDGVEPTAIATCMAGSAADQQQPPPLNDLAARFDLADLARTGFDMARLLVVNRRVLCRLNFAAVADRLPAGATEAFWLTVRGSLDLLNEARFWWDVVAGDVVPPVLENRQALLTAAATLPPAPWDDTVWARWIAALEQATGKTGGSLLPPLRLALTGEDSGPDLANLLPLIGRARAAERLRIAAS